MSAKFTTGEWHTKREGASTVYVESAIGGGWIQEVAACGPTANGSAEQEANARLISAAPELLEALIALEREKADYMRLNNLGDPAREHNTIMARSAIAKATGETK